MLCSGDKWKKPGATRLFPSPVLDRCRTTSVAFALRSGGCAFGLAAVRAVAATLAGVVGQIKAAALEDQSGRTRDDALDALAGGRAMRQRGIGDALFDFERRPILTTVHVGRHGNTP